MNAMTNKLFARRKNAFFVHFYLRLLLLLFFFWSCISVKSAKNAQRLLWITVKMRVRAVGDGENGDDDDFHS